MTRGVGPVWGLVAAAGAGRRFGGERPKQYVELDGRPLVEHAIRGLAADPRVHAIMVVVPPADSTGECIRWQCPVRLMLAEGGADRRESVANGLDRLAALHGAAPEDWVLIHDAARPCLHPDDLAALIDAGAGHPTGALLASPVRDTLKRSRPHGGDGIPVVEVTVARDRMWRALTPQMFRLGDLAAALAEASARGAAITDDSEAMEARAARQGRPAPRLVEARFENLKVTAAGDLESARRVLRARTVGQG